jgi:hypothetical protein
MSPKHAVPSEGVRSGSPAWAGGAVTAALHWGHSSFLPASPAFARKVLPQPEHRQERAAELAAGFVGVAGGFGGNEVRATGAAGPVGRGFRPRRPCPGIPF